MSADLFVTLPDETLFSEQGCVDFVKRFGVGLVFSEGIDLGSDSGWMPCEATGLGGDSGVDCGFELDRLDSDSAGGSEFALSVDGDEPADWVVAHLFGLYCVAKCGAVFVDPQEDTEFSHDQLEDFETLVRGLVDEARAG